MRVLVFLLVVGCGPIEYVNDVTRRASDRVEAAKAADADKYAPYYWTRAKEYLYKARERAAYAEASTEVTRELEASGVPPAEIDAGYPLNGWRLYAHPEHLPPGADRRSDVPFVTGDNRQTMYALMSHPTPDVAVVRVIGLPRATWQAG